MKVIYRISCFEEIMPKINILNGIIKEKLISVTHSSSGKSNETNYYFLVYHTSLIKQKSHLMKMERLSDLKKHKLIKA